MSLNWKKDQKQLFAGRGQQWIYVDNQKVIDLLEEKQLTQEASEYIQLIQEKNKAWVRYSSARVNPLNKKNSAAFEIRYQGSKIPQPDILLFIDNENIVEGLFERLEDGKTPFALGLENSLSNSTTKAKPTPKSNLKTKKITIKKDNQTNKDIENVKVIQSSIPVSNDPSEWEQFLLNEGFDF